MSQRKRAHRRGLDDLGGLAEVSGTYRLREPSGPAPRFENRIEANVRDLRLAVFDNRCNTALVVLRRFIEHIDVAVHFVVHVRQPSVQVRTPLCSVRDGINQV